MGIEEKRERDRETKRQQTIQKQLEIGPTGAEQVGQPSSPVITKITSAININRIHDQTRQAKTDRALAETTIKEIDTLITKLSEGPSRYTITNPETGETRQARGSDVDNLKQQRSTLTEYTGKVDAFLLQAPSVINYYENKKKYADTKKTGTTYSVTILTTNGTKKTETFTTRKEAQAYADALNRAAKDKAQTRATERSFIGLTLAEAADVIRQKRKGGKITKKGYVSVKDSKQIEELIQQGKISPEQSVVLSKGGEIEIRTINTKKQQVRYRETIDDEVTLLLDRGRKALGDTDVQKAKTGRQQGPLSNEEFKDAINRANYLKYTTAAGIIIGVGATLDPRTYIELGEAGVKAVANPAKAVASTAGVAIALKTAYDTDPIATSGLLLGSVMGSYLSTRVLGPSVRSFYQKGIVPAKTKIYGKITDATKTFYEGLKADTSSDLAQAIQYPLFNELAQSKKFKPISDNILKTISADPLAAPSFYDKGPQLSLWDQFRQWSKYDFSYIPADPSKATTGVYNKYVEFLNIQAVYLGDKLTKGLTTGAFGEFLQTRKITVDPDVSKWVDSSLLYFLSKKVPGSMSEKDKIAESIRLAIEEGWTFNPADPNSHKSRLAMFDERDVPDYLVDSIYGQMKGYFTKFGIKDSPLITKQDVKIAIRAFKEAIALEKTGPMAIQVEAQAVFKTLVKSGVSASKAQSIASRYAFGLVTISAMKNASSSEIKGYMSSLQMVMADLKNSDVVISNDMVADLTAQFNRALQMEQIKSFQSLFDKADTLNKNALVIGEINEEDYKHIISQLQDIFPIQEVTPDEAVEQIITPVPPETITEKTPPIKLSLEDKKKRRDMDRKFYTGPKSIYRVTYIYSKTSKQTLPPIEARSILEATTKAQRAKEPNRKPWIMIDIEKVKG